MIVHLTENLHMSPFSRELKSQTVLKNLTHSEPCLTQIKCIMKLMSRFKAANYRYWKLKFAMWRRRKLTDEGKATFLSVTWWLWSTSNECSGHLYYMCHQFPCYRHLKASSIYIKAPDVYSSCWIWAHQKLIFHSNLELMHIINDTSSFMCDKMENSVRNAKINIAAWINKKNCVEAIELDISRSDFPFACLAIRVKRSVWYLFSCHSLTDSREGRNDDLPLSHSRLQKHINQLYHHQLPRLLLPRLYSFLSRTRSLSSVIDGSKLEMCSLHVQLQTISAFSWRRVSLSFFFIDCGELY